MGAYQQSANQFTIPAGQTQTFTLQRNAPLERLTVWAVSGGRTVNMTFQVKINGQAYNAAVTVTGAPAADVIYRSGGAITEDDVIPYQPPQDVNKYDPFVFTVDITNNDVSSGMVTIYAIGIQHLGS